MTLAQNKDIPPQVASAQIQEDINHPLQVYYSKPFFYDLSSIAQDLKIDIWPEDKVESIPPLNLGIGSKIFVQRAAVVEIIDAKKSTIYRTWQKTVGDLLKEKNLQLLGEDSVSPSIDTPIMTGGTIKITRVAEVDETVKEEIAFSIIKKEDIDLEKGQTRIEKAGIKGEKEVTYHIKRVDGEEVSREVKETKILKEPESQVLIIGIGPKYTPIGPYKDTLNAAARKYLINGTALWCLMMAESGGSADAGYPDATYKGLFQYTDGYWADASTAAGYEGASIYDGEAQIYTTAWALTHGQSRRWPIWGRCANK